MGPVDRLDTIADLRRNEHIVHDMPIVLQKSVASICCCRSHSILQLPSAGKSIIGWGAAGRWVFAAPHPPCRTRLRGSARRHDAEGGVWLIGENTGHRDFALAPRWSGTAHSKSRPLRTRDRHLYRRWTLRHPGIRCAIGPVDHIESAPAPIRADIFPHQLVGSGDFKNAAI